MADGYKGRRSRARCRTIVSLSILGCLGLARGVVAQQVDAGTASPGSPQTAAAPAAAPSSAAAAPQAIAPPPAQPPSRSEPPLPNRLNEVLPQWLRVRGEFRDRMEGPTSIGFTENRDDLYWQSRFRFDISAKASPILAFQMQLQDARAQNKDVGTTGPPFRDVFDLRQGYADIGDTQKGLITVRAGRQELVFGEQRLVGHLNWVNAARSFDGVRATLKTKPFRVDVFGSSVVRIQDGEFDKSGAGNRFFGAYGSSTTLIPKSTVEPYFFWKGDENLKGEHGDSGNLKLATIGARWVGKLPAAFDYGTEMAMQTGSLASDSVSAWAGHWILGNTLGGRWKVRVAEEYNFASGDDNPTDGRRHTFDQLYPTGHDKIGLSDQIGWRNIHDVRSIVEFTPHKGWPASASYHSWWLADTHDALYAANGAATFRVPSGVVGSHVGQELDLQVTKALVPQVQLAAGLAKVFPSDFLKQVSPGAKYTLPYVMVTYVFLAEK